MTEPMLNKSITKDEQGTVKHGVLQFIVPFFQVNQKLPLPPELPGYWSYQRDSILRNTIYKETMWAAAVSIAITKVASLSWEISGNVPASKMRYFQQLFLNADGKQIGWVNFLTKQLRDYLNTDNGSFIEIVRASKSVGSQIIGLKHLDSLRVTRSGDPEIPILYRSKTGIIHELKAHQVMMFSDMPDSSETYYGVGTCASSRAYPAIYKLAMIEKYLTEKVTGLRPLAIYIVNGLLDTQLKQAVEVARSEEQARGMLSYMGAVMIGVPDDVQPQVATIPLAELPDRFARREEFDIAIYSYAANLGLDIQDLVPLGGIALGTGMQSQILHEKARGKGLVSWKQSFTHMINTFVLPPKMKFAFVEKDYRDMQQAAQVSLTHAQVAAARIAAAITTAPQELQVLVDKDELPKEFLAKDITGNKIASDDEKVTEDLPEPKIWGLDANGNPLPVVSGQAPQLGQVPVAPVITPDISQPKVWGLDDNGNPLPQATPQSTPAAPKPEPKIWGLDENGDPLPKLQESPPEDIAEPKIWGLDENGEPLHKDEQLQESPKVWGLKEIGVAESARQSLTPEAIDYAKELYRQVMNGEPVTD